MKYFREELTLNDFAFLFGITAKEMPEDCRILITNFDFIYRCYKR